VQSPDSIERERRGISGASGKVRVRQIRFLKVGR
jgi:hypothetical protein